jgi:hypothetical protein
LKRRVAGTFGTAPVCFASVRIPFRRANTLPAAQALRPTICDGTLRVESKTDDGVIEDGIASPPTPPVRPLKLAALTIQTFSALLDKYESKGVPH